MTGVVTLGETMGLLAVPDNGLFRAPVPIGMGGAESNVAIGLARLGVPATWMSRLGDDALGTYVLREIRAEGVTVLAARDPVFPTGLMLKELRGGAPTRVRYYRSGSAASQLTPDDVHDAVVADAEVLHLTGITPALGPGPLAAVRHAIAVARSCGTLVSLDVNHRRTLWSDEQARTTLLSLLPRVDLLFAGPDEASMLLTEPQPDGPTPPLPDISDVSPIGWDFGAAAGARLADLGPSTVVVKLGALGSLAVRADGTVVKAPATAREVVDPVGAGDAFVAGYLATLVGGGPADRCLDVGNRAGGIVVSVRGDWEGLPTAAGLGSASFELGEVVR